MPITPEQKSQLDLASERVASGKAGAAAPTNPGDVANLKYATEKLGYKYEPANAGTKMADAVVGAKAPTQAEWEAMGNTGVAPFSKAPAPSETKETETGTTDWMQSWLSSAFGNGEVSEIKPMEMTDEKLRLEKARTERIQSLDTQYAVNLADLKKQNVNTANALKARLIKLGISPSDSAWSNAEAGQIDRDRQAEARLYSEYMSNKAAIEADLDAKISNIALQENSQKFNAQVQNMNNWLQKVGQGISLYSIFSQRDQSEKDREQSAYNSLLDYQGTMATLDQNRQLALARNFMENAQKGYYNISDKNTLEMLAKMEKDNPDYLTGIVGIATQGLSDRLLDMSKKELEISKTKAEIAKLRAGSGTDDGDKETKAFYEDVDSQLTKLSTGKTDWGTAFSTIKSKYGAPDDVIDTLLNKNLWAQPGAYESQQKERSTTQQPFVFTLGNQ